MNSPYLKSKWSSLSAVCNPCMWSFIFHTCCLSDWSSLIHTRTQLGLDDSDPLVLLRMTVPHLYIGPIKSSSRIRRHPSTACCTSVSVCVHGQNMCQSSSVAVSPSALAHCPQSFDANGAALPLLLAKCRGESVADS